MKWFALALLIGLVSACASAQTRTFIDNNGLKNYQIVCGRDGFYCYEEAGKICGTRGYYFSESSFWDEYEKTFTMIIVCKS